jgi:hypothetical protein
MSLVRPSARNPFVLPVFSILFAAVLAVAPASAACGDGVLNPGEDCDDGSGNGNSNSCCTTSCTFSGESPDVIVGDITTPTRYGTSAGITAFSIGTTSCNLGSCWLNWIASTAEHPVIGQNMFRLKDGRFEHVGQAWLKHGFTALTGSVCATCIPPQTGGGSHLGVNCSDPYVSSLNGTQSSLGPKVDVDPNSGVFPYPDSRIGLTGDVIYKRLQVHNTDLDPSLNAGALYFVEGQYVTHDDALAKNNPNNASYRPATVSGTSPTFNLALTGSTVRQKAGIQAWKTTDPTVTETILGAAGGEFIVSAKATSLGGGIYHYEYAVQNLNNQRAGQTFTVPIPAGTIVTNVGFHDVDYHSGEPFDGTDWTPTVGATSVSWTTTAYAVNQNANALRWGTLYNFRFDANQAPGSAPVVVGLFKPGAPTTASVTTVVPGPCVGAPNGNACNDNNACTLTDSCQSGICTGSTVVVCSATDACHDAGTCAPATGVCSNPAKANGSPCTDANACTQADTCQAGSCAPGSPVVCAPLDQCHDAGLCNPANGACGNPNGPDGRTCSDGDACTQTDACQSGLCAGASPVVCTAIDACHDIGTCSSATGVCSNPAAADGTPCDDANDCTANDACTAGACAGEGPGAPGEVAADVLLSQSAGVTTISWSMPFGATWSSVLRGLVTGLPVGPGAGDEVCLDSGVIGSSAIDAETPNPGDTFWYLVAGGNPCAQGPYGFQVDGGVQTPRVSTTCP